MDSTITKTSSTQVSILNQSFGWMFAGLMLTAAVSFAISSSKTLSNLILSNGLIYIGFIIAELVLVIFLSVRIRKMTFTQALASFFVYAVLNGITLSVIVMDYTATSVGSVFLATAAIFGIMAAIGYTTKKDLTSLGMLAFVGLIGVIVASIINIFLKSSAFSYVLSYVTIIIFLGLTAYDTQKIKQLSTADVSQNYGIIGALMLYLDFVNIFINLLRIFGKRS